MEHIEYIWNLTICRNDGTIEHYTSLRKNDLRKQAHCGFSTLDYANLGKWYTTREYKSFLTRNPTGTIVHSGNNSGRKQGSTKKDSSVPESYSIEEYIEFADSYYFKTFGRHIDQAIALYLLGLPTGVDISDLH